MQRLIQNLITYGQIEIIIFGEHTILNEPIHKWAQVNCLIAFYSEGFPLEKAIAYCELRKPFCINDLPAQKLLLDRRSVYGKLDALCVPVPRHVVLQRDRSPRSKWHQDANGIEVDGVRMDKPFVEKPASAEDHNNNIYYAARQGGGCRKLFRKVDNECSRFFPEVDRIREDGTYIYEEFVETDHWVDIKVYIVGGFVHAEQRRSPCLDGQVQRAADGREMRTPCALSDDEKALVLRVAGAFGQTVCGLDLLRTGGKPFVIDVNGWSFVKGKHQEPYYKAASEQLYKLMSDQLTLRPFAALAIA